MAHDDPIQDDTYEPGFDPPPDTADWWVWGVRRIAGTVAELLYASRGLAILFIVFKAITWAITDDPNEPRQIGLGIVAFAALWAMALLLHRFATERDSPDPGRWLAHRRHK